MRKEKFVYNTQSLRYEKVVEPLSVKLVRIFGFVSAVIISSVILISVLFRYFPSPHEQALLREIDFMNKEFERANNEIGMLSKVLDNVQERDASVHRILFGMDPIDKDVWNGGIGGHDKYSDYRVYKHSGSLIKASKEKADLLTRQLVLQSKSLDTILSMAKGKEKMLASIPAIKPIREDKLKRKVSSLSGFGMRLHPIFKRRRMHRGIDFTCPKGTPIQATGDGVVKKVLKKRTGYGTHVIIDHGYGYETLYAHMDEVHVKKGHKIKRMQQIGTVGNTGTSTAAHLHYEVIQKGRKVNPIHYCMDGLTPQEYQELVNMAHISNQSFD